MSDDPNQSDERRPRVSWALRRAAASAGVIVAAVVLVAACGSGSSGPGVANTGSPANATKPSSPGSQRSSLLAYSRCMRAHGIPDFPDPNSNGGLLLQAHQGSDLDPNNPQLQAAQRACKSLAPAPPTSGPGQARAAAAMLKYARCMRAHGITDFPDPGSNGQLSIKARPGSDLNPNGPQFQSADKACHGDLPGGGGRQTSQSGGGSK